VDRLTQGAGRFAAHPVGMTRASAIARYILVPDARTALASSPSSPIRRFRLERVNPRGRPARGPDGYAHLKRVYD
jgi:hypothetical protein